MKIDLHCHSYYSPDGICSPKKLLERAKKRGLDGIALTDHNTTAGWPEAKRVAQRLKMFLILGEEIKIKKEGKVMGEILGYFLKEEINPKGKTIEAVIKEIKQQGGIAIIAHPFHRRKPFKELEKYKNLVDGIEVFNPRSQTKKGNEMALKFAKINDLPMTAGSDAHSCWEVGNAFIETKAKNLQELKEAILKKEVKICGKQSPLFVPLSTSLGRILHLFWKPQN